MTPDSKLALAKRLLLRIAYVATRDYASNDDEHDALLICGSTAEEALSALQQHDDGGAS